MTPPPNAPACPGLPRPPRHARLPGWRGRAFALAVVAGLAGAAQAQSSAPLPSFAELEAAGVRIGEVRIVSRDIFNIADPLEDKALFRWANALHVQTRPAVIRRSLLFKSGELLSARTIEENERLLRNVRYLYDVQIRPLAVHDGVVDIEVLTRDTWSLDPGLSASRAGGANSSSFGLRDYNLLGSGIGVGWGRSSNVDRSGSEFELFNPHLFGSWASLNYNRFNNSDGRREAVSLVRPFHELDARWSAGITVARDDRVDALYDAGTLASQYRHQLHRAEVFGGWSAGLIDGWARRYTVGLSLQDDRYAQEPGAVAPPQLPTDQKLVSPFVRVEWVEDRYEKEVNRNLIGRTEYFALGLAASVQIGRASTALGSSRDAWLYTASISRGLEPAPGQTLVAVARLSGQTRDGRAERQRLGVQAQYYRPQGPSWLFYVAGAGDVLTRPDLAGLLELGGDNGLRGYPLRYQRGTRRVLFTAEERFYTDLYVWRLFRIGGAAFYDAGRAWGGDHVSSGTSGWLSNVGFGLRIVSSRAAFSNVLHVDLAFPMHAPADAKRVQFLVRTKASF